MTEAKTTSQQNHYSVLLLDDDRFLLDMYSVKFTQAGFTVQATLAASEAIEALRGGFVPDAILFDVVMPVDDGFSFLKQLREQGLGKGSILIALTNESEEQQKKRIEELGGNEYIVKASTIPSEVVHKVEQAIAERKK
jgi:CheY-like chemotaxis protein